MTKLNIIAKKGVIHSYNPKIQKGLIWCFEDEKLYTFDFILFHGIPETQDPRSDIPVWFRISDSSDKVVFVFERPIGD